MIRCVKRPVAELVSQYCGLYHTDNHSLLKVRAAIDAGIIWCDRSTPTTLLFHSHARISPEFHASRIVFLKRLLAAANEKYGTKQQRPLHQNTNSVQATVAALDLR